MVAGATCTCPTTCQSANSSKGVLLQAGCLPQACASVHHRSHSITGVQPRGLSGLSSTAATL